MRRGVENPSDSTNTTTTWKKIMAGSAAVLSFNMLTACGGSSVEAVPSTNSAEPTVGASATPGEVSSESPISTPVSTESPTAPNEANTAKPELTPGLHSFEEDFSEHLKLDQQTVQGWIESNNLTEIANAMTIEVLNASENTFGVWISSCRADFNRAWMSPWKSIDEMTGPELACQGMVGGGLISTATKDGKLYPEGESSTPHDTSRAAVLTDLAFGYWSANDETRYGTVTHDEFMRNSQSPFNEKGSVAMTDYSYTDKAKKVGEAEATINGTTYRTVIVEMDNILNEHINADNRTVIEFLRVPATKAWELDSGWEDWGGKEGDGSMRVDEEGNPITLDGGPVEMLIPYRTFLYPYTPPVIND